MGKSVFKDKWGIHKSFDREEWVVTIFNAGAAIAGHAALLIEGEDEGGRLLLWRCEIFASEFKGYLCRFMHPEMAAEVPAAFMAFYEEHSAVLDAISDKPICYISIKEYAAYPRDFSDRTATSWRLAREKVELMLEQMEADKRGIDVNTRQSIAEIKAKRTPDIEKRFTLFKLYGNASTLTSGDGINCVNWCERQLKVAGIKVQSNSSDSVAARPEDHAAQRSSGPLC